MTTRTLKYVWMFVLMALVAAVSVSAGVPVNERRPASDDAEIGIEMLAGSIRIIGWNKAELEVTGTIGDSRQELEIDGEDDEISIEVVIPEGRYDHVDASHLEIRVPRDCHLEIETVSADIEVSDLRGDVEAETVSGTVDLGGGLERAEVSTVSGTITLDDGNELEEGDFETVSGNIDITAHLPSRGHLDASTVSGPIDLRLPSGIGADFEVSTFSGTIENELGPAAEKTSIYLPTKELKFSIGGGGAKISLNSFSGNIRIRSN